MSIKLTDDEVAAVGSLNGGWPWALLTVDAGEMKLAVERGQRSLIVRDLLTGSGASEELLRVASFAVSARTVASAVVDADGTPSLPVIQVLLIAGDHGTWLLDARLPMGIHRMDVLDASGAREYLLALCRSYAEGPDSEEGEDLALLTAQGEARGGVVIGRTVWKAYRDGDKVGRGEVIAVLPLAEVEWSKIVDGVLAGV